MALVGLVIVIIYWTQNNELFGNLVSTDNRHTTLTIIQIFSLLLFLYAMRMGTFFEGTTGARVFDSATAALLGITSAAGWYYSMHNQWLIRKGMTGVEARDLLVKVLAADSDPADLPWEKVYLNLGWFFADTNSGFHLGDSNVGACISIDVEVFLGLDSTTSAFRLDGGWRFTQNKRHKLEFGWFVFKRDSSGTITEDIDIPPELGGGQILAGPVKSEFNFDIIKLKYEYSVVLDDRLDLNLGVGLFIMPIEFGVQGSGGTR